MALAFKGFGSQFCLWVSFSGGLPPDTPSLSYHQQESRIFLCTREAKGVQRSPCDNLSDAGVPNATSNVVLCSRMPLVVSELNSSEQRCGWRSCCCGGRSFHSETRSRVVCAQCHVAVCCFNEPPRKAFSRTRNKRFRIRTR